MMLMMAKSTKMNYKMDPRTATLRYFCRSCINLVLVASASSFETLISKDFTFDSLSISIKLLSSNTF